MNIQASVSTDGEPLPPELLRFVERFATVLVEAGMPRMPARVFAALLTSDSGRMTARELAQRLQVSPAAVSGAVRYLGQLDMLSREREPGSRRDHYALHADTWYEIVARRERVLERWQASTREGIALLGPDTPAGLRMAQALAFFEFTRAEMRSLLARWRELAESTSGGTVAVAQPAGAQPAASRARRAVAARRSREAP